MGNETKTTLAEKLYNALCDADLINFDGYADENPEKIKEMFMEEFKNQFIDFSLVYTTSIIGE